ncbi:hypothetical protein [Bartonella tribocorum]|nr:hypothetical protein [Bartonella tribocorum]
MFLCAEKMRRVGYRTVVMRAEGIIVDAFCCVNGLSTGCFFAR